jgi:phosphoadenosine phosphosulfate reductase
MTSRNPGAAGHPGGERNGAAALPPSSGDQEGAPPDAVLRWAAARFEGKRLALVSAFGPGSAVLIHLLADVAPALPVIFVDTLHHFPETLEHVERVRARYRLDLHVYRPLLGRAEIEARHGPRLWERDLELYQQITKVEPFRRATRELNAWITGRRRDQAGTRSGMPVVEEGSQVRINPLASWTGAEVWRFIVRNQLPYNPLHDRGYPSIGDQPLTHPVPPAEQERVGRWRGTGRLECGIHLHGGGELTSPVGLPPERAP